MLSWVDSRENRRMASSRLWRHLSDDIWSDPEMSCVPFRLLVRKYAFFDWVLILICTLATILVERVRFSSDFEAFVTSDIRNPLKTITISNVALYSITFILGPLSVAGIWAAFSFDPSLVRALSAYFFSVVFTHFVTSSLKFMVGRPRPDTVAFCGGDGSFRQCASVVSTDDLNWQFRSFPSLHASLSMAAAVFISLTLCHTWKWHSMVTAVFKFCPVMFALVIGASRVWDRACRADDVGVGFFLGAVIALAAFKTFVDGCEPEPKKMDNPLGTDTSTSTSAIPMRGYV